MRRASNNLSIACSGLGANRELEDKPALLADGIVSLEDAPFRHDLPLESLALIGLNAWSEMCTAHCATMNTPALIILSLILGKKRTQMQSVS